MPRTMMQAYVKNSAEAFDFYLDAFGASQVCRHLNADGSIAHAEMKIFGQTFALCETAENEVLTGNSMQFCLDFGKGNEELVRKIIDKLSCGGRILLDGPVDWSPLLGSVIDKFGVSWLIFA